MSIVGAPRTDLLGEPFTARTIELAPDDEGEVVATLVHRPAEPAAPQRRAVLHVHGFNDYFFHQEYAQWWAEHGYDFYALDLRKYGRSLLPHQTAAYITDLRTYAEELDAAWEVITGADAHTQVVLSGHSTGGLILGLWASDTRPSGLIGLVLNSPWLDLRAPLWVRTLGTAVIDRLGAVQPYRALPRSVNGVYGRSLHRSEDGEFDFDLAWKPLESLEIRLGWLRAIRRAHAELHRGLQVGVPTLVLTSDRTSAPTTVDEDAFSSDIVLDVAQIRRWAPALGSAHLSVVIVPGAMHDVVLSRVGPRATAYAELDAWVGYALD